MTLPGLLAIREMVHGGDGWSSLVYRPDLLGGVKVANVNGRFPLYPLLVWLGLPSIGVWVLSTFVVHALLGFIGCRAAADFALVWSGGSRRFSVIERVAQVWLCAFAPVLGWRFGVGHPALIVGLLPFATALTLIVAGAARTLTLTLVAVSTLAIALGLLHVGQQLVLYGAIFGAPILLGAWLGLGGAWRRLAAPALVAAGAVLLALPALWGILAQAGSSDSPRLLGAAGVTYSLLTATARDWAASLPWMRTPQPAGFQALFAHEVNYPVGPLVVLLLLVPWRRARALAAGLALSLVAILVFSMDLAPWSRALLSAVPALDLFRVPARAALLWLWTLPVLAAAGLVHRDDAEATGSGSRWRGAAAWATIAAGGVAALALPPLLRELGTAALVVAAVVGARRGRPALPAVAVMVVLGLASVAAFAERLPPFATPQPVLATADRIGGATRAASPALAGSLARVRLDAEVPGLHANTAFAAGISSLDGYAIPTRRFAALVFALNGQPYNPTANIFQFKATEPAFPVLRQLYNVGDAVALAPEGRVVVAPLGPTAGPAWFSASVVTVGGVEALARELGAAGETLHARAREVVWRDGSDPRVAAVAIPALDAGCRDARVSAVRAPRRGPEIVAETVTAAACPLTFAANFTDDLRATAVLADGRRVGVPVFPAYGALAGVLAPGGATAIHLRAEPVRLPWAAAWVALGLACCAAAAWLARRG